MRVFRLLWGLSFLVAVSAAAQDPAQVDPKHCKVEFENAQLRVLRWHVGPHEKVPMHEHPPGWVISLTDGASRFALADGKTWEARVKAGQASQSAAIRHALENLSDEAIEAIQVELKTKAVVDSLAVQITLSLERGAVLGRRLSELFAQAGSGTGGTTPPPGAAEEPCYGAAHGQVKCGWGPTWGCMSGPKGENLTNCMQAQSSQAGGCASANCWQNACQQCGGSWAQSPSGGSGSCITPDFPTV